MQPKTVDVCFIGGGLSTLYAAYMMKQSYPDMTFVILEALSKVGGRAQTHMFEAVQVPMGAGIGRARDIHLKRLCKSLGFPIKFTNHTIHVAKDLEHIAPTWKAMWKHVVHHKQEVKGKTFKEAATKILGHAQYTQFVKLSGYSDYEEADAWDVIHHYGMQDNEPRSSNRIFFVNWQQLIRALVDAIGNENIKTRCRVVKHDGLSVETGDGHIFKARKHVVFGVPVSSMKHLHLPVPSSIKGQPFIRVYARFADNTDVFSHVTGYTVVSNDLQKVIPMNATKRIMMIAYADNECAHRVHRAAIHDNKKWFEECIQDAFPKARHVQIVSMWYKWWNVGTHYTAPSSATVNQRQEYQNNKNTQYMLIGEAMSKNQGWVEGAFESVHENFLPYLKKFA